MINDCPLALMQSSIMVPSDPNSGSRRRRLYRYRFHFLMAMKERLMAENVANVSVVGRVLVFILLRDGVLDCCSIMGAMCYQFILGSANWIAAMATSYHF